MRVLAEDADRQAWTRERMATHDLFRQTKGTTYFANLVFKELAQRLDLLDDGDALRQQLQRNSERFRAGMTAAGFTLTGAGHPIIPVMLGDAKVAGEMAQRLLAEGLYVIAFSYPVVPQGRARIRTQMSAAHSDDDIDMAVAAFTRVGRAMGVVA